MSSLSVERSIRDQIDHMAMVIALLRGIGHYRSFAPLSQMVEDSADSLYIARVKPLWLESLDYTLAQYRLGSVKSWIDSLNAYFANDAGIVGVTDLPTALAYYRAAVPSEFADLYFSSTGTRLASSLVWAGSYLKIAIMDVNSSAVQVLASLAYQPPENCRGDGAIRYQTENTIGSGSNLVLTTVFDRVDGTTYSTNMTIPSSSAPNTEIGLIGSLGGASISGTTLTTSTNPATLGLVAGQRMIVRSASGLTYNNTAYVEEVTIVSITHPSNYEIVTSPAIKNTTGYGSTIYVEPCWKTVSSVTFVSGNEGDKFNLMYAPDRNFDSQFAHTW